MAFQLSKTVKPLRLYPAFLLTSCLPQFCGRWWKTRNTQVRDNAYYYSQHSRQHVLHAFISFLVLQASWGSGAAQVDAVYAVGLYPS